MKRSIFAFLDRPGVKFFLSLTFFFVLITGIAVIRFSWLMFQTTGVFVWKVLYQRGLPFVIGFTALAFIVKFWIMGSNLSAIKDIIRENNRQWILMSVLILTAGAAGIWIAKTGTGLVQENAFFGKPTVPILEWHLLVSFLFSLLFFSIQNFRNKGVPSVVFRLIPVFIWLISFILWISIPNQNGFFSPAGRAPNFETYPFSDGSFYGHYARSAAAGMGFKGEDIPPRPLYIAALTFFHLLAGNDYDGVIFFQTLVLALFPALVYLLGKELHSPEAGLCAAFLVILRETNCILSATFAHNVSTTKYFFADIPCALAVSFFLLMAVRWAKHLGKQDPNGDIYATLTGCALAIVTLIRTQGLVLIFGIPLVLCAKKIDWRACSRQLILFFGVMGICFAPWLIRNHQITGGFVFDHPMTQTAEMARSYNFDQADLSQRSDENESEYSARLSEVIQSAWKNHPDEIIRFITNHFWNNVISNFRQFPVRNSLTEWRELIRSEVPFWETYGSNELRPFDLCVLGAAFVIFAFGVGAAFQRGPLYGILPLLSLVLFDLSTATGRYSAGRYLVPTNWIILLYFSIGAASWCGMLLRICGKKAKEWIDCPRVEKTALARWVPVFVGIILTAAAIPLADKAIPETFTPAAEEAVLEKLGTELPECGQESPLALKAIAIYPRYYAAEEGEPESAKQGYRVSDYGRMVFLTLAPDGFGTFELKMDEAPKSFADGSTIWLTACENGATSIVDTLYIEETGQTYRKR